MILVDPDLDPDPEPKSDSAKTSSFSAPSTRSLAQFLIKAQCAVQVRGQVTVLLTTDATIRDLNRRFRGQNKPTDVLSFPAAAGPGGRNGIVGDVAISVETARRRGTAGGHALVAELKILILHGLLHLAGYDHEADDGRMARRERVLRARLGLPEGLIERASSKPASQRAGKSASSPTLFRRGGRKDGARARSKAASQRAGKSAASPTLLRRTQKDGARTRGEL